MARPKPLMGRPHGVAWREAQGAIVRRHRLERGLTQQEVADAVGLSKGMVSSVELGRNFVPPERVRELAEVLRVDLHPFSLALLYCTNPVLADIVWPELADAFEPQWQQVRHDQVEQAEAARIAAEGGVVPAATEGCPAAV